MNFNQWVEALPGRPAAVAQRFSISESAVSQWRSNGVPLGRMEGVCAMSDGDCTLEELVRESSQLKSREAA